MGTNTGPNARHKKLVTGRGGLPTDRLLPPQAGGQRPFRGAKQSLSIEGAHQGQDYSTSGRDGGRGLQTPKPRARLCETVAGDGPPASLATEQRLQGLENPRF